ncbi:MAG: TIGR02206 family membrane protein [Acidobacteria bacterium]|nr:TIGR02206 family membrane protein [Acidobacteriota bacterium]
MASNFQLFGPTHWLILLTIPALPWLVARIANPRLARLAMGTFLLLNELGWYGYKLYKGWFQFPSGLPLQLCDLTLWLTVVAALTLNPAAFEFAFFTGLVGAGMAVLTPDLWEPFPSYGTVYFFLAHGGVISSLLYLWWSGQTRPQPGCVRRSMALLNIYGVAIGIFNAVFGANYMYLCRKPQNPSLLDYMGPWPLYILAGEALALIFFTALWLPFSRTKGQIDVRANPV